MPLHTQVLCMFEADWTGFMETYPDAGKERSSKGGKYKNNVSVEKSQSSAILQWCSMVISWPCSSLSRLTGHICGGDWVAPSKRETRCEYFSRYMEHLDSWMEGLERWITGTGGSLCVCAHHSLRSQFVLGLHVSTSLTKPLQLRLAQLCFFHKAKPTR